MNRLQTVGVGVGLVVVFVATILHNPIGGYAWDDGLYSKGQFMRMFREAFPEYADLSDSDLWSALVKRYPEQRSWVREETDGSPPRAIPVGDQPTNYRMTPPPAYFGHRAAWRSTHAMAAWIDEPVEYMGFVIPTLLAAGLWYWLFRRKYARRPANARLL